VPRKSKFTATSHIIAFNEDIGIGPELRCPSCGGSCLHHEGVTLFDREEDAELTTVTTVTAGLSASHLQPSREVQNPLGRRDGIAIRFWCEGCRDHGGLELTIAQHKGGTYFSWRFESKK